LSEIVVGLDVQSIVFERPYNYPTDEITRNEIVSKKVEGNGYMLSLNEYESYPNLVGSVDNLIKESCPDLVMSVPEYARYLICFDYEYLSTDFVYAPKVGDAFGVSKPAYILSGDFKIYDRETGKIIGEKSVLFDDFPENDSHTPHPEKPYFSPTSSGNHFYALTIPYIEWLSEIIKP